MNHTKELILSLTIIVISLLVYVYLFGFADRRIVFLYEHLGFGPFDRITLGRYWMTGLVLSGFLTILYLTLQLITVFLKRRKFNWKLIVKYSLIPLFAGVLIIMMTNGNPKMPLIVAGSSALALIAGTAIGFSFTDDLISDFSLTLRSAIVGMGLVPFLMFFKALELPGKGILTVKVSVIIAAISLIAGIIWLFSSYTIFGENKPNKLIVLKSTLAATYVALPLIHLLFATPKGIKYISSSDNFFADNLILRFLTWGLLVIMVYKVDKIAYKRASEI